MKNAKISHEIRNKTKNLVFVYLTVKYQYRDSLKNIYIVGEEQSHINLKITVLVLV